MIDCTRAEELLVDELEAPLPAEQRALLDAHLAGCEACRGTAGDFRRIRAAYRALPDAEAPSLSAQDVLARAGLGQPNRPPRLSRAVPLALAAAALLLVALWIWRGLVPDGARAPRGADPRVALLIEQGDAERAAGDRERAIRTWRDALSLPASDRQAATLHHRIGEARLALGAFDEALAELELVARRYPDYEGRERALFSRGAALEGLGEIGRALQAYEQLAAEFPESQAEVRERVERLGRPDAIPSEQIQALQSLGYAGD